MKCGTVTCDAARLYRIHWPGKTIELCKPCALRAANIADAMGFTLTVDPIDPETPLLCVVVILDDVDKPKGPPS